MSFNKRAKANIRKFGIAKQRQFCMLLYIYLVKKLKNEELLGIENFQHSMALSRQVLLTELRVLKNAGWINCLYIRTKSGYRAEWVNILLKEKSIKMIEEVLKEDKEFEELREKLWEEINDYYSNELI